MLFILLINFQKLYTIDKIKYEIVFKFKNLIFMIIDIQINMNKNY